jgi:polysaccharide biosynthesis protein VpsM
VLLSGLVSYVNSDYQGITRTDDQIDVSIAARYLITRNLSATADLTYTTRSSDVTGVPYDRGVAMLALKVGF